MKNTITNCTKFPIDNIYKIVYNLNMSVRKIKKSYISCTGYFASKKNNGPIAFESVLERDFYTILEFDNSVASYEEQPIQFRYKYSDGNKRRYTPDTLVTYTNGIQKLIEVKYQSEFDKNKELYNKIKILKEHIKHEYALDFEVFTDENFDTTYLYNLKFLYKFVFIPEDIAKSEKIDTIIVNNGSISIKALLHELASDKYHQLEYTPYIWNYIYKNIETTNIDLNIKITMSTIITVTRI